MQLQTESTCGLKVNDSFIAIQIMLWLQYVNNKLDGSIVFMLTIMLVIIQVDRNTMTWALWKHGQGHVNIWPSLHFKVQYIGTVGQKGHPVKLF